MGAQVRYIGRRWWVLGRRVMDEQVLDGEGGTTGRVTLALSAAAAGDGEAAAEVLSQVYDALRAIARAQMQSERNDHTLQATALVHEAYMRLVGSGPVEWGSRAQFYFAAGEAMRRILVERARGRGRLKRGGDGKRPASRVPLAELNLAAEPDSEQIVMLDDALRRLEEEDRQAAAVVRLRFFAGLSIAETAQALGVSTSSVDRDWAFARAKLHRMMRDAAE